MAQYPQFGGRRDQDLRPGVHSFPVGEYVIIYCIQDDDALILPVMRGSRDIEGCYLVGDAPGPALRGRPGVSVQLGAIRDAIRVTPCATD